MSAESNLDPISNPEATAAPGASELHRRDFLKGVAVGSLAALADTTAQPAPAQAAEPVRSQVIKNENARPGSPDWQLTRVRLDKAGGFRTPWIETQTHHNGNKDQEDRIDNIHALLDDKQE